MRDWKEAVPPVERTDSGSGATEDLKESAVLVPVVFFSRNAPTTCRDTQGR
jgi:hypothetical protein